LRLVIDTDMAPDDVVAIVSLLRDPTVEVLAITVTGTGEAHCQGGMFVARSAVTMLAADPITVACGRSEPLGDAQPFPDAWRAGADTGNGLRLVSPTFGPDPRWAEQVLVDLAAAEAAGGSRLAILTLGPLTNLASAVELDPAFASRVTVTAMLGAVDVPGNVQPGVPGSGEPTAEWNAHADPTAVRRVLEAGFDITLVGLDATKDVPLTPDLFGRLESDHAAAPADIVYELWARNPYMVGGGYYIWDPLAAAVVREPTLVTTRPASLRVVEGAGLDGGRLVEIASGALVTIATSADRARFEELLLASLRIGEPRPNPFQPTGTVRVTAGLDVCEVSLEPVSMPAGLLQLDLQANGPASTVAFSLAGVPWSELEAFARAPDFEHPPAVTQVAGAFLESPGSASAWGTVDAGPIGIACAVGDFERPTLLLQGPFEVVP
jgi:pyrimidine-specific ribonucleoside hydrolase